MAAAVSEEDGMQAGLSALLALGDIVEGRGHMDGVMESKPP